MICYKCLILCLLKGVNQYFKGSSLIYVLLCLENKEST